MKWILFTGTWKLVSEEVESDVRNAVREVIANGNGIITGGALGVDYFALQESLLHDVKGLQIRVILPTKLHLYEAHFYKRVGEGVITLDQFKMLFESLHDLQRRNSSAILEINNTEVKLETYFERDFFEVCFADEVYAFQVNESKGTQDTLDKAEQRGVPVTLHKKYTL